MSKPTLIQLKAHGLDCWHLVAVKPLKQPLLARLRAGESIDINELGEVLQSGWGMPPAETTNYSTIDA